MRSDREHCGSRVAVEQEDEEDNERRRTTRGGGEEEEEEEDQATDIKSNNPHLAGGEIASGYVKIAMENGPFIVEIVDLPIENGNFP